MVDQLPDPAAERRAELEQAGIAEPVVHEPQAEPSLEASWQPGDAQGTTRRSLSRTPSPRWRSANRVERIQQRFCSTRRGASLNWAAVFMPKAPDGGKHAGAFREGQV